MTIDLKSLFGDLSDLDTRSAAALLKALKTAFTDEFGYLRFKQSVRNMQDMGLDEATSIKSAFATASTMGLTKQGLMASAHKYQQVLKQEREEFAVALKSQLRSKVDGKRAEAKELEARISAMKNKIAEMEKEMALYQKKIDNVDGEMAKAKTKLEATKNKFLSAYNGISSAIEDDIKQIDILL